MPTQSSAPASRKPGYTLACCQLFMCVIAKRPSGQVSVLHGEGPRQLAYAAASMNTYCAANSASHPALAPGESRRAGSQPRASRQGQRDYAAATMAHGRVKKFSCTKSARPPELVVIAVQLDPGDDEGPEELDERFQRQPPAFHQRTVPRPGLKASGAEAGVAPEHPHSPPDAPAHLSDKQQSAGFSVMHDAAAIGLQVWR